jgi:hypothetical protein
MVNTTLDRGLQQPIDLDRGLLQPIVKRGADTIAPPQSRAHTHQRARTHTHRRTRAGRAAASHPFLHAPHPHYVHPTHGRVTGIRIHTRMTPRTHTHTITRTTVTSPESLPDCAHETSETRLE